MTLLSCLVALAASSEEECAASSDGGPNDACTDAKPAANRLNFFSPAAPNQLPLHHSPRDTPQLGDRIRSAEASGIFFDSLDTDGDGAIESEEVARFLRDEIGGKQFDTQSEVDEEVGTIMKRLDQNHNNGLEMSDMLNYWLQLESLLTAEEVAEWIVYSVQLPSSVGKIFLENGITGYDFLEIVDNGGVVLEHELGITKASFRNKIVRQMQSRMLGIGSSPETPQKLTHKLESCKAVTLSWEGSIARVFPVHSYRIQRRAINLFGTDSMLNGVTITNSNNFDSTLPTNSDWKTVYVGGDTEYVDSGLETGHNYMYRVQAWNSVGRSGWETIDLTRDLKRQRCSTKPPSQLNVATERGIPIPLESDTQGEWLHTPKRVVWGVVSLVHFLYQSVRFFLAIFALLAGMMRFRRATATSSATATTVLPFPWIWHGINRLSNKLVGQEFIPRTMLGDKEALIRQEQLHDERIMATGLRGYDRLRKKSESGEEANGGALGSIDRRSAFKKRKSHSTGDLLYTSTVTFGPPKEICIPGEESAVSTPSKFPWMRPGKRFTTTDSNVSEASAESASSYSPTVRSRVSGISKSDHSSSGAGRYVDDGSRCSECKKKFRIGKRYKHHCCRCMATFCHKHGKTTHNNFTSCKVPGDCMCNTCLDLLASRGTSSERSKQGRRDADLKSIRTR